VDKLLSLIEAPKSGHDKLSGKGDWLLDSGASHHMIGDLGKLTNVYDTHPVMLGMPNGQSSMASKRGRVKSIQP